MAKETQIRDNECVESGQKTPKMNDSAQNANEQEKIKSCKNTAHDEKAESGKEKKGAQGEKGEGPKAARNAEITELTDTLKRVQAEFENYQKRAEKENGEFRKYANAKIIEEILPVLDTLEQGIIHNKCFVGVQEQLMQILRRNGLEKIGIREGNDFDHETMECMLKEKNEKTGEGKVARVLLNGYKLNGKVLRHAKVSVNKQEAKNAEKKGGNEN